MIQFRIGIRREIRDILAHKHDGRSSSSRSDPTIFTALRDSPILPPPEKAPHRLEDEATLLVMAGTESTAKSLTLAHCHLLANPPAMAKLRAELADRDLPTTTPPDQLPYLNGVIQEAHRLSFGLTGRNPRVAPDEPIVYHSGSKTFTFPPGTPLSTSTLLVHTNEALFPDPWRFEPARWLGPAGAARRRYMLAFMRGPRMCIGMHLANAEMAAAVAAMARWDMRLVDTTADDVAFLHDYHVATPRLDSKGVRVEVVGRAS
jgi:cytochrome P450